MFTYTYIQNGHPNETRHETAQEALQIALDDIEYDTADPLRITDAAGAIIYNEDQIAHIFVNCEYEPIRIKLPDDRTPHIVQMRPMGLLERIVKKLRG